VSYNNVANRFNPSVGILFIQAAGVWLRRIERPGFNPSVGILFIQAVPLPAAMVPQWRFNPSVGILFIQADPYQPADIEFGVFQSLGRDSVHSSSSPLHR